MLALIFALNMGRNKITDKLEVEIYGETLEETNRKKVVAKKLQKLTPVKASERRPASVNSPQTSSSSISSPDEDAPEMDSPIDGDVSDSSSTARAPTSKDDSVAGNKRNNNKKKSQPKRDRELPTLTKAPLKPSIFTPSGGLPKLPIKTEDTPTDEMGSSQSEVLLSNNIPDGSYLSQPFITLTSSNANLIKYCVGTTASTICCDPDSVGVAYSGPFQLGTTDGNYCLAAKGYTSGLASSRRNWNYVVDASLVSLNLTLPQRRFFQTQQLFENIMVNSTEFGDSSLTFLQRVATTDPAATACETLASSTGLADMETSLGFVVNFGTVTAPFEVPLLLSNELNYGMNYLVSIVERLGSSRSPASASNEYVCLQNAIEVKDFHVEGISASKAQAFPGDGSYGFQGQLNTLGSGKALGANGITLEHGILNIIN